MLSFAEYEKLINWIDSMRAVSNLIEAKNSKRPSFATIGKWSVSYAHKLGKGWLVLPESRGEYDFILHKGVPQKVKLPRELSVYELNDDNAFYLAPSKEGEKITRVFEAQTSGRVRPTGYVPRTQRIYVSRDTFYELTGYTPDEYHNRRKLKMPVPVFVITETINEQEKFLRFVVKQKARKTDTVVFPVQDSYFCLPSSFYNEAGRPASTNLPTKVDFRKKEIIFEAPVERCSCCGTVIRNKGRNPQRGLACRECTITLDEVKEMSKKYSGDTPEVLTAVFDEILENLDKYSDVITDLIKATTHK